MTDFPDILGMELHDAKALLEAEGLDFIVVETKPSKKELTEGILRVINVVPQKSESEDSNSKQRIVLTVCMI